MSSLMMDSLFTLVESNLAHIYSEKLCSQENLPGSASVTPGTMYKVSPLKKDWTRYCNNYV